MTNYAPPANFRKHFSYDDQFRYCVEQDHQNEMTVVALAASGARTELCKTCQAHLMKSMTLNACIEGLINLARAKGKCADIEGLFFTDCRDEISDGEVWQDFVFSDDDTDDNGDPRPVFRISLSCSPTFF